MFLRKKEKHKRKKVPQHLTKKEQRHIRKLIQKARNEDKAPRTVQQSIPFERMFPDGVCRVRDGYYTKTIEFQDINYQLAQQESQVSIFEDWCSFLNFFDSSIHIELSFLNKSVDKEDFEKYIRIPHQDDEMNELRDEYSDILKQQMELGNNGLKKTKYITFGIESPSMKQAKPRLEHIQLDILNNFKRIGAEARVLDGKERLQVMHAMFHVENDEKFFFEWDWLVESGLSVKDFISPSSFDFSSSNSFKVGNMYGAMSFFSITSSDLNDEILKSFLEMDSSQIVTMHINSIDQNKAIREIKHKITELDRSKIEEQKKAVRAGYDMDILPSDLATYGKDAKSLLSELMNQNERMFLVTVLIMNTGRTLEELNTNVFQAKSIAQKYNCNLCRLDYQQENALMSSLPLASNTINIKRQLTTSSLGVMIPFTTLELFQTHPSALYYGLNALSNNFIYADRKKLKNPNGLILGTPGAGKSFSAKREIANVFLKTDDDIMICDPESEYTAIVQHYHGQVIKISATSPHHINPLDINQNYSEEDDPIALKSDFILSLCELIVADKSGLKPIQKSVIDRCVHIIYRKYFENPVPDNMPILEDLYDTLRAQKEPEAQAVASSLEMYVKGSLNVFNNRTNVDIHNRIVCYDTKEIGNNMKKIAMLVVQDQVWGRVTENRNAKKSTRYYIDEFHLLLKEEQTAAYSVEIWKRFRKWGGIPTGITQNVTELLQSREISNIIDNSDFVYLLNLGSNDRKVVKESLNLSNKQVQYVTNSDVGEGLMVYGNIVLPFVDKFPKGTKLFESMNTKLVEDSVYEAEDNKA